MRELSKFPFVKASVSLSHPQSPKSEYYHITDKVSTYEFGTVSYNDSSQRLRVSALKLGFKCLSGIFKLYMALFHP